MCIIEQISDLFTVTSTRNSTRKIMQSVELEVKMDCDGCERRVRHAVSSIKGAVLVEIDRMQSRVLVSGFVDPNKVLKRVRGTVRTAQFWPYVEHNLAYYPYAPEEYDIAAPCGYARNVVEAYPTINTFEEKYATLFSDENPNSCLIM